VDVTSSAHRCSEQAMFSSGTAYETSQCEEWSTHDEAPLPDAALLAAIRTCVQEVVATEVEGAASRLGLRIEQVHNSLTQLNLKVRSSPRAHTQTTPSHWACCVHTNDAAHCLCVLCRWRRCRRVASAL
jgi:hypothetical protein